MPYMVEVLAGGLECVEQPGVKSVHSSGCLSIPSASLSKMRELEGEQEPCVLAHGKGGIGLSEESVIP